MHVLCKQLHIILVGSRADTISSGAGKLYKFAPAGVIFTLKRSSGWRGNHLKAAFILHRVPMLCMESVTLAFLLASFKTTYT